MGEQVIMLSSCSHNNNNYLYSTVQKQCFKVLYTHKKEWSNDRHGEEREMSVSNITKATTNIDINKNNNTWKRKKTIKWIKQTDKR